MKLAKSILCGVAALGMTAGAAVAQDEGYSSPSASNSESYYVLVEPMTVYEETYVIADPSSDGQVAWNDSPSENVTTYYIYDVDGDTDGKADRQMMIERSDTVAYGPSDADLDYSSVD
jgi:hypothetical protein